MSRLTVDAELALTKPGEGQPYVTVPEADLESGSIEERIQDAMDSGSIAINNDDATYTSANHITSGDKAIFRTQLAGEESLTDRWTAIVRDPQETLRGGRQRSIELSLTDFVFTVLSWRLAYETFDAAPISGSNDAILESLLASEAPEIDRSQIATVDDITDGFYNGRDLFSIVTEDLAPTADALVSQDGTSLVFEPLGSISPKHTLRPDDFRGDIEISRTDDGIANLVRVDGGTAHDSDDEQPDQSDYTRVTDSSRITRQVQTRKSEVDRILIHVRSDDTSDDGLVVRLQSDRGGQPVDVDDTQSDIARKTLAADFLADDGLTTFILPAHQLAPREYPWLIIEADGPDGHDIGVNADGVPRYRAEYPYPLLSRVPRSSSQAAYRRRDHRIKDESLDSFDAVRDKARSYSRHHDEPERTVSGEADSLRAHQLAPGEAVDMRGWPVDDVSGEWICIERSLEYQPSTRQKTTLTLQDASTI